MDTASLVNSVVVNSGARVDGAAADAVVMARVAGLARTTSFGRAASLGARARVSATRAGRPAATALPEASGGAMPMLQRASADGGRVAPSRRERRRAERFRDACATPPCGRWPRTRDAAGCAHRDEGLLAASATRGVPPFMDNMVVEGAPKRA
jgi:hypothetical protein